MILTSITFILHFILIIGNTLRTIFNGFCQIIRKPFWKRTFFVGLDKSQKTIRTLDQNTKEIIKMVMTQVFGPNAECAFLVMRMTRERDLKAT